MLVLTRKVNESIIIGDQTEVMVVEIKGDQVKIGVRAPRDITVYRGEIYKEIQKENIAAAQSEIPADIGAMIAKKKKK